MTSDQHEPSTEFDFTQVDIDMFNVKPDDDLTGINQEDLDCAITALRSLLQWVWQDGSNNEDGVKIRGILVCWIFLKELRSISLTQMAKGYRLKKQSLGRWHDDFKETFPTIKTPHMKQ